jgi:uncharacterized protein (TIGR02145 family)
MKQIILTAIVLNSLFVKAQTFTCGDTLIDIRDGREYATVLIGSQCWMQQNLNFGTMLNHTIGQSNNLAFEKYCYNDDTTMCNMYGGLYQWNEAMDYSTVEGSQGICPIGWHLPGDNEWKMLEMHLGMSQASADSNNVFRGTNEAFKMKAGGISGFEALYAGAFHGINNTFGGQGTLTLFWASSLDSTNNYPFRRGIYDYEMRLFRGSGNVPQSPLYGYCLRCVTRLGTASLNDNTTDILFNIYPNPVSEYLYIEVSSVKSNLSYQIINMTGKVVKSWASNESINYVDVKDLSGGLYFMKITSKNGTVEAVKKIQVID